MKGIVMKLSDVIMEVQEALECEKQSYKEIEACYGEVTKGWIEALEYTQGLLNRVTTTEVKTLPEPTYNGYTNKPTWSIMSWINNDQVIYKHFHNKLSGMIIDAPTGKLVIELSDYIKSWFSNFNDDTSGLLGEANPIADILGYVLAIINWEEIAEHLIDDYESEVK